MDVSNRASGRIPRRDAMVAGMLSGTGLAGRPPSGRRGEPPAQTRANLAEMMAVYDAVNHVLDRLPDAGQGVDAGRLAAITGLDPEVVVHALAALAAREIVLLGRDGDPARVWPGSAHERNRGVSGRLAE